MNRNEITLQEMFSSVIRELREGGRWGTAHIYQSAVNAFSAFTKWQPMPMRRLSPTVLKRFENFLRQRNCSWNTVSTYIIIIAIFFMQMARYHVNPPFAQIGGHRISAVGLLIVSLVTRHCKKHSLR